MQLRFLLRVFSGWRAHFSLALNNISLSGCPPVSPSLSVHSLTEHLLPSLGIVNKTVCRFLGGWKCSTPLGKYQRVRLQTRTVRVCLALRETAKPSSNMIPGFFTRWLDPKKEKLEVAGCWTSAWRWHGCHATVLFWRNKCEDQPRFKEMGSRLTP